MHKILINALGTESSGGISILRKTIQEVSLDEESQYYIFVYSGKYIDNLLLETNYCNNLHYPNQLQCSILHWAEGFQKQIRY